MALKVAAIATVFNEAESIDVLLASLGRQTRQPDEVIIVDGGSTDGTLEKLERLARSEELSLKVLSRPGCNIAQGRNIAIAAAEGPLIAVTDAGVRLEDDWLEQLLVPFESANPPDVVGGFFVSAPSSLFEVALGAVTLPLVKEVKAGNFCPSSRSVAFRRVCWAAAGGYPEWLDYCEDLLFDFALRDAGYRFAFAPKAVVYFRPRPTLRAFFKQYYRYARGDGKADFWRYRHLIRYGTYLGAFPLFLTLAIWQHPLWLLALIGGSAAVMRTPARRLGPQLRALHPWERFVVLSWMPVIRWAGDIAKMLGYPVGIWWRWRHAPKIPWPKRQL